MKFAVNLDDIPGSLAKLLALIAQQQANVLHIYHRRSEKDLSIYTTRVELELETRGWEHHKEVAEVLKKAGYGIEVK